MAQWTDLLVSVATVAFIGAALRTALPLILAGLGESISERTGLMNIGLEAIMLAGAFFAFFATFHSGSLLIGVIVGATAGMAVSLIHAFMSLQCRVDQTLSGLALNFCILGLTSFIFLVGMDSSGVALIPVLPRYAVPVLSEIPALGPMLFSQDLLFYFALVAVPTLWVLLYKTEWGLNMESTGEAPHAADSVGLSVFRIRYAAALINGLFGGLAGAYLTLGRLGLFIENVTGGRGYIALVVVIIGRRNPIGIVAAALLIGAAEALQFRVQTFGIDAPANLFIMLPHIITITVLFLARGRTRDPAALGRPFFRDSR